jgi:hypothetical protein
MIKSDIENEIDAIRISLYEQTKHMTISEFTAFINNGVAAAGEKYGFKLSDIPLPEQPNEVNKKSG